MSQQPQTSANELCFLPATEQARLLRQRKLSARELMAAHLAQIEETNPQVNAIVTLLPERAMAAAAAADDRLARGEDAGILHSLPIAHKDLLNTKGIRTTLGSPIFADMTPDADDLIVERIRAAGAIAIGKTNTPEFGAGSHTFNPVFGATRNPYDLGKTVGGSSGGAAAALASGMIPIADGSDMGGSLRNPANFCNVVGLRVSPGRVPTYPRPLGWFPLSVQGPMGRTVGDVALLLAAIAGADPKSPIAINQPGGDFLQPLSRNFKGCKVGWSRNLGGLPVAPEVTAILEKRRETFEKLGCQVVDVEPDFSGADEAFKAWRAWSFAHSIAPLLPQHREQIKETILWNVEVGLHLTGQQLSEAEAKRTVVYHRIRELMGEFEYLVCPVSQVLPFAIEQEYPTEINGVKMESYIDWMKSCYYISAIGLPAISVPFGFTEDGLPVGGQIVGRHQADFAVLQLGHAFEKASQFWKIRPKTRHNDQ